jgi:hypothetical protein
MNPRALAILAGVAIGLLAVSAFALARGGDTRVETPGARQTVPAPIDGLDVRVLESSPPQYRLIVQAGLPSGCAMRHSHALSRTGDTITVSVLNSMPTGNPVCTMIYGSYELSIDLGTDFRSGSTYTIRVNDRVTTFTAQ